MSCNPAPELCRVIALLFGYSLLHLCIPDCFIFLQLSNLGPSQFHNICQSKGRAMGLWFGPIEY